ncbi:hypothetical protein GobsT_32770 [Gemmata obscuriglobus]|uniref:Lipoprotein n=1 Tax=Gemmata obscuriglobus TaxID=114 RepID=A0A2Z3GYM3_9BACT|nr:hypothetical protein [Gemmata obscuriglobus]AWM38548.1 hypothetical protein C1280_17220 [Gemmata obscuriglobus]QEG28497.1 hypothetical protein GobsT_32770 [Gemmata obscuriglobus]VTS06534.1 unnamed protein product [Gemmata obscuriglobus UQM 2246]
MFAIRSKLYALAAAVLVTATVATCADAGWVTIKNDTNKALVVQEVTFINGKPVRGKPTKLLGGESFREFQNTAGEKSYEVYEVTSPQRPVWSGKLNCKADTQSFSVVVAQGKVNVVPAPDPKKP